MIPDGMHYRDGVASNTQLYLDLLAEFDLRATFFTVGDVARRNPDLIRRIVDAGHEVAAHTSDHVPLDRRDPASLRADLEQNRGELEQAGAREVVGFRAPIFSLTEQSAWAYEVLAELGFRYSSSVLPHRGPLYGWESFGPRPRQMPEGVWEFPVSAAQVLGRTLPFAGGVYFRVLPFFITRRLFASRRREALPVVGYFHPYDVDTEQERFMHAELGDSQLLNTLMYIGRGRVIPRLRRLFGAGIPCDTFAHHVGQIPEDGSGW